MANMQHRATFTALFKIWGFPEEAAQEIGRQLSCIDNGVQDNLIEIITTALEKKQILK